MSERTCRYCNNRYNDNWSNWVSKYCCKECYRNKKRLYNKGETVYTYDDRKLSDKSLQAVISQGVIINIYEVNRPTQNGLWIYAIRMNDTNRTKDRFEHQIFNSFDQAYKFVDNVNTRRYIMRQANKLIKEI